MIGAITLFKILAILFVSRQGLICLFSFLSLIFVSYARKNIKEGMMKEMTDNVLSLAFITYLFTFFNILIRGKFIVIEKLTGEFILNVFIILIIIVIIKTTVDILNYSKKTDNKIKKRRSNR